MDFKDFSTANPFEEFEGSYIVNDQAYDVTIKYVSNENSLSGTYVAVYNDGSILHLDYTDRWVEKDKGDNPHAKEIGRLINERNSAIGDEPAFNISIQTPDDLMGMPEEDVPFRAGYTLPDGTTRYVVLQSTETDTGRVVLVSFVEEDEEASLLTRESADLSIYRSDELG